MRPSPANKARPVHRCCPAPAHYPPTGPRSTTNASTPENRVDRPTPQLPRIVPDGAAQESSPPWDVLPEYCGMRRAPDLLPRRACCHKREPDPLPTDQTRHAGWSLWMASEAPPRQISSCQPLALWPQRRRSRRAAAYPPRSEQERDRHSPAPSEATTAVACSQGTSDPKCGNWCPCPAPRHVWPDVESL